LKLIDYPISTTVGNLYKPGGSPTSTTVRDVNNYVNYITGAYSLDFSSSPAARAAIEAHTVRKQPSKPFSMLFYDGEITLSPVPDKPYKVEFNAFLRPSELLDSTDKPERYNNNLNRKFQRFMMAIV